MPHRRVHNLYQAVRHMCQLLALAFWFGGVVRAGDAIRVATNFQEVPAFWNWMNAIFGLGFFYIGTLLWLEGKQVSREKNREFPPEP